MQIVSAPPEVVAHRPVSLKVYLFFFLFGLLTPFGGDVGKAFGLLLTAVILLRLFHLAILRRQDSYGFMFALGLLGAGELYYRDFAIKGSVGYLVTEYALILLAIVGLPVVLQTISAPRHQVRLMPYLFFWAWSVLSIWYSPDPIKGRWFLSISTAGLAAIVLALNGQERRSREGLLDGLVVGSILVLGVALNFFVRTPEAILIQTEYRFGHTFTSAVQIGTVLSIGGLAWFVRYYQPGWARTLAAVVPIALLAGSAFTLTRTSALAVFVGLLVLLTWRQSPRHVIRSVLVLSAIGAVVVFLTLKYQSTSATERFTDAQVGSERINIWLVASDVIADSPVVGYGVGSWASIYPAYSYRREEAVPYVSDAHNLFVQVLVESGLIGALGLIVFFGMLLLRAMKSKNPVPLSFALFVLIISMTANLKIVAPFLLLGTSVLYTLQRTHPGPPLR